MDLYDRLLASYRPSVQAKKWWWPSFINALNTSIVAAWRLQCHLHPDEKTSHLQFRRTINNLVFSKPPTREYKQEEAILLTYLKMCDMMALDTFEKIPLKGVAHCARRIATTNAENVVFCYIQKTVSKSVVLIINDSHATILSLAKLF